MIVQLMVRLAWESTSTQSASRKRKKTPRKLGSRSWCTFKRTILFDADIHEATVVTLFLLNSVNLKLRPKLLKDLKPGTRIVSNTFHTGAWKPHKRSQISTIYVSINPILTELGVFNLHKHDHVARPNEGRRGPLQ
jgi:hypothetical protein